jgi:CBS domain-containing protein
MMITDPVISAPEADVRQVIEQIRKRGTTYSLVTLWGELQGIITYRDCVKFLAEPRQESLPISIIGLPEDPFEAEAAKAKFERIIKRLARSFPDILEARSVVRVSEKPKQTRRYEVRVELITPRKTMSYALSGWNLPEIFDELSERMK